MSNQIFIKFVVRPYDYDGNRRLPYGALFYQWLPDGQSDAIYVPVSKPFQSLSFWFERYGKEENGFVSFDVRSKLPKSHVVGWQSVYHSGPVHGQLIVEIDDEALADLKAAKFDSVDLVPCAKKIIKSLPTHINHFINVLRFKFGQFWIEELPLWDSRSVGMKDYFRSYIASKWSEDGAEWKPFEPDDGSVSGISVVIDEKHSHYISEADWSKLKGEFQENFSHPLWHKIFLRSKKNYSLGDLENAVVDACSALEIFVNSYIKSAFPSHSMTESSSQRIRSMGLKDKVLSCLVGRLYYPSSLGLVFELVEVRNRVVHEGGHVERDIRMLLESCVDFFNTVLDSSSVRFSVPNTTVSILA